MIAFILSAFAGYLGYLIGSRTERGLSEASEARSSMARKERGRQGAMKLRPIRIRR